MRTTGGSTLSLMIIRSSLARSSAEPANAVTKDWAACSAHDAGLKTHLDKGRRPRPLERGRESTNRR
jgi:hypothetical protein